MIYSNLAMISVKCIERFIELLRRAKYYSFKLGPFKTFIAVAIECGGYIVINMGLNHATKNKMFGFKYEKLRT